MRNKLNLLLEELRYLKREGISFVYCEDESIEALRSKVEDLASVATPVAVELSIDEAIVKPKVVDIEPVRNDRVKVQAKPAEGEGDMPEPLMIDLPEGSKETQWNWLKERVLSCPECNKRVKPGKKVVFGVGNLDADIFFCGEAPGAEDEIEGEPFVGKAGDLLNKIIKVMGLQRSDVYIGNIMNWRPEMPTPFGHRPPTQREMEFCLPYLKAQLEIIKPKVIIALGATAVSGLLGADSKRRMSDVRGQWSSFQDIPLMITFHPSYLLRNNTLRTKRQVWEDIMKAMEKVGMEITDKQQGFFLPKES